MAIESHPLEQQLQNLLLLDSREEDVRDRLISHATDRLLRLTRKMLGEFGQLRRWEQTDDVFQNAMIRLHRALADVRVETTRHFFNLAALQVRRELLDLCKHYYGPLGLAANHDTDRQPVERRKDVLRVAREPWDLTDWTAFHEEVGRLDEDGQEVFNLLYYEGLSQQEAATLLGVSVRTVKRRWQAARITLHKAFQ